MRKPSRSLWISIAVSIEAHERLTEVLRGVNDEHRVQLLIKALS